MADEKKTEATNSLTGTPGGESPAVPANAATISETQQVSAKQPDSDQGGSGFNWDIFWLIFFVAVFIWMWRTGKIAGIKQYIVETREQLRKSTWPTRDELKQHITVVLISSLLLATFTFAADFVLREIVWGALMNSKTV
ncbi:MAG: preprotein translocase subunit SecE, partial [Pedosphaera sp.]|nr:preprotein translocase subunit SecE [Pedosphaera sp.]